MKKLIIFDQDGTLLDTIGDLGAAVNYALSLRGLPLHTNEEYRKMIGHGVRNLVISALPEVHRSDSIYVEQVLSDFKSYYCVHIADKTRPYPGIVSLLHNLSSAGFYLGIASNKFQQGTQMLISKFFGDIPFVSILGNRSGAPLKPSPEIVWSIADAAPDGCGMDIILVGDSETDMATARAAGITGIGVTWGFRTREDLHEASIIVDSVPELRGYLLK